jgi:hypothetical protein
MNRGSLRLEHSELIGPLCIYLAREQRSITAERTAEGNLPPNPRRRPRNSYALRGTLEEKSAYFTQIILSKGCKLSSCV